MPAGFRPCCACCIACCACQTDPVLKTVSKDVQPCVLLASSNEELIAQRPSLQHWQRISCSTNLPEYRFRACPARLDLLWQSLYAANYGRCHDHSVRHASMSRPTTSLISRQMPWDIAPLQVTSSPAGVTAQAGRRLITATKPEGPHVLLLSRSVTGWPAETGAATS